MASFVLERIIPASPEAVFDLSLDVGLHLASQSSRGERAVGAVASGTLGEGDQITWSARHFGIRFRMTSIVFDVDRPRLFRDRQTTGPFGAFRHTHEFEPTEGGTLMRDTIGFHSPFGPLGRLVDAVVMRRHLIGVITERNDAISAHFA
ncbi:ligand-binding SRPBCC domain-containing protein [Microbacterium sp. W4I4]|uniref:SRPBCC family protein n=1 Tax=Microbacterium sp. W4I4 TaxID=3042295 RepID=UPI002782C92B|nr:SRPBCC family protein [Microbacterium sp. W4I4]MDQ0615146.1 ligand-binding SRPBCC domain-containing protein [Microbacterium sp. W4I4]